jgi:hypothetical protein
MMGIWKKMQDQNLSLENIGQMEINVKLWLTNTRKQETSYSKKFEVFESIVWRAVHYVLADSKFHVASFKKWGWRNFVFTIVARNEMANEN